jgi:hypothetical protein
VEVMPGNEVSEKFGGTIQDLRKLHGLNSCILEFEIFTLNIESGHASVISKVIDEEGNECVKLDVSSNTAFMNNCKEYMGDSDGVESDEPSHNSEGDPLETPFTTLLARDKKGTWKCPSVLGDVVVAKRIKVRKK